MDDAAVGGSNRVSFTPPDHLEKNLSKDEFFFIIRLCDIMASREYNKLRKELYGNYFKKNE